MPEMRIVGSAAGCASCHEQRIGERHVDFDVAYEGPVLAAGEQLVPIDKLVVCERCLTRAAKLIGFADYAELHEQLTELNQRVETAETELAAQIAYASQLESTIASKPQPAKKGQARGRKAVAV